MALAHLQWRPFWGHFKGEIGLKSRLSRNFLAIIEHISLKMAVNPPGQLVKWIPEGRSPSSNGVHSGAILRVKLALNLV